MIQRLGWQASWGNPPAWATRRNPARATFGPAVGKVSKLLGKPFFPWQQYVADVAREVDPETGGPWYETVILFVQRRSGKTIMIPPLAAHECGRRGGAQAWITAQSRDNAVKRWREATDPLVPLRVGKRKVSNMFEELRWPSNSLFRPFAPKEETLHGEDPDLVFVDEYWTLGKIQAGIIREGYAAAWSVKPGQEWLMSAAGTHASTAMKDARKRGREASLDPDSRVAFFEWCVPETVGSLPVNKIGDEALLQLIMAHHPRTGFGLRESFIASEIGKDKTAAIRAFGGLDSDTSEVSMVIDESAFRRATDKTRRIPRGARVAFGLAADPDLRQAAITAGWQDPQDGRILTELIEERDQVRWSVPAAVALLQRWPGSVLMVRSDASGRDLADDVAVEMRDLELEESRLVRVSASDYAAACVRLRSGLEAIPEPSVLHLGERKLRTALQAADWHRSGWVPARGPVAVLAAHTLAVWGSTRIPAEPEPEPKFWVY